MTLSFPILSYLFHYFISLPILDWCKIAPIQFSIHPSSIKPIVVVIRRIMDYIVAILVIVISQSANLFAAYIYANETDRFLQCGSQVAVTFDKNQFVDKENPEEHVRISLRNGDSMDLFENIDNPIADIPIGLEIHFQYANVVDVSPITKEGGKSLKDHPGFNFHVFKNLKRFIVKFNIHEEEYTVSINEVGSLVPIPRNKSHRGIRIIHISGFPVSVIKNVNITYSEVYRCTRSYTLTPFLKPANISRQKDEADND